MCSIDWSSVSIVFATLIGPILAVWASEWRQHHRQLRERKEWVFRTLMSTRSAPLQQDHVMALNNIDFVFPPKEFPQISDAWGLYLSHLHSEQGNTQDSLERWGDKSRSLLADLIYLMALDLKIPFSKTQINAPSYYPKGYAFNEYQQNEIRTLLLALLKNERSININTKNS